MFKINRTVVQVFLAVGLSSSFALAQSADWKVKKTAWSDADEKEYSEFVSKIGQAVEKRECNSFQSCLNHPNNPYRGSDGSQLNVFADCAKLSYVMRGYFAWKKGLPFSVVSGVELRQVDGNSGDARYSRFGNVVTERMDFIPKKSATGEIKFTNAITAINKTIVNEVYSANFRVNFEGIDSSKLFADFYPIELNRDAIMPGTNIYDPNGHVAIVYKVTDDGRIYFIDAHPDNSLTSGLFGTKFVRSNPGQGAGFKNFRPIHLDGAQFDASTGSYYGGTVVPSKDSELPLHSLMQFFGTNLSMSDWKKGVFQIDGTTYAYYDYLRMKMSKGNLKLNPMSEIKSLAEDLCQTVQDRLEAVNSALKSGVQQKAHPAQLPVNIYGTSGEWEESSTPSRDARLKTSFKELRDLSENLLNLYNARDPRVVYNGTDIKGDMINSYKAVVNACKIQYTKSNGEKLSLSLEQVRARVFALSFDPYHCAELRWGASSAAELATCTDDSTKRQWYQGEQWLRNQIERRYDVRMDFSLADLTGPKPGAGVATPPDTDIIGFLSK
ncbi:MAG: hypothetical protein H7256_09845 [Bdellovibrio sp.]|nr:hypothetical protein [Bdellovibrio sp.]